MGWDFKVSIDQVKISIKEIDRCAKLLGHIDSNGFRIQVTPEKIVEELIFLDFLRDSDFVKKMVEKIQVSLAKQ